MPERWHGSLINIVRCTDLYIDSTNKHTHTCTHAHAAEAEDQAMVMIKHLHVAKFEQTYNIQ